MTNVEPAVETSAEQQAEPAPSNQQRTWSMPKPPISRKQVDDIGRRMLKAMAGVAGFVATAARYGAISVAKMWRRFEAVPTAGKLSSLTLLALLLGISGAIALDNALGVLCTVAVVPVCAGILGALGHRWYSRLGEETAQRTDARPAEPADSELQKSVEYVDRKLTLALTSFGTEHHQQAVIALFQAKTAVELTLGTEQDLASYGDIALRPDDYGLRPRIRGGSTSTPREGNSLAS
ncbi:hypothetical protein [Mycolicibacterium wolinskyi]|uniref:hypothetical protein n=1 Tax=Mycolicibacterium wolinskyi TaxID=59750 RepID=UPI000AE4F9AB|nr:hypothetical protein [Mycolicibacterium wolinskyi]